MHLLDKINSWVQSGPMGNDKQDPLLITAAVLGGAKTIGGWMDEANEKKARESFMNQIGELGAGIKSQAEEFFDISQQYAPGGSFYQQAGQDAINTAMVSADKGYEKLLSQGIELTDYGLDEFQDVTKETYTSSFVDDYKQFAEIGVKYASLGADMKGKHADLMSSAYTTDYMGEASETSFMTDIADFGTDMFSTYVSAGMPGMTE